MNRYINKECPYCHKPITVDDNIVVCSKCGIAHHVDCWNENHGCSTYGCDGQPHSASGFGGFNFSPAAGETAAYSKAPLWSRFWASVLDSLIIGVIPVIGVIILAVTGSVDLFTYDRYFSDFTGYNGASIGLYVFGIIILIGGGIWGFVYDFIKDGLGMGQSYGKRAVGLMVVDVADNTPCSKGKSALRNLIMTALCAVPWIGHFVEPIMVLANDSGRRLGDLAANTQVVSVSEYRASIKQEDQWGAI